MHGHLSADRVCHRHVAHRPWSSGCPPRGSPPSTRSFAGCRRADTCCAAPCGTWSCAACPSAPARTSWCGMFRRTATSSRSWSRTRSTSAARPRTSGSVRGRTTASARRAFELTLWYLYAAVGASGLLTVRFNVAYRSALPRLVPKDQLVDGNAKLSMSQDFAELVGPSIAGLLVGLLGAVRTLLGNGLAYLVSAGALLLIRPAPSTGFADQGEDEAPLRTQLTTGLALIRRQPILLRILACTATSNFFVMAAGGIEVTSMIRDLHATPTQVGLVFSISAIGGGRTRGIRALARTAGCHRRPSSSPLCARRSPTTGPTRRRRACPPCSRSPGACRRRRDPWCRPFMQADSPTRSLRSRSASICRGRYPAARTPRRAATGSRARRRGAGGPRRAARRRPPERPTSVRRARRSSWRPLAVRLVHGFHGGERSGGLPATGWPRNTSLSVA